MVTPFQATADTRTAHQRAAVNWEQTLREVEQLYAMAAGTPYLA